MTVTPFKPRQPKGRPSGGEYAPTVHAESAVSLGAPAPTHLEAPAVPEKLRMAYIPRPDQAENLDAYIGRGVESGDTHIYADLFAEALPNLSPGDAQRRYYDAVRLANAGHPYDRVVDEATAADHEAAPYGGLEYGYTPPGVFSDEKGYTRNATVGAKHDPYRSAADIAKDIRAELKAAVSGNYLPQGLTFSVRSSRFAGGQSIRVDIQGLPDADKLDPVETDHYGNPAWRPEAKELESRVEGILSAYNREDNDGQIDYFSNTFYGSVDIESDSWREFRAEEAAKKKAARAS